LKERLIEYGTGRLLCFPKDPCRTLSRLLDPGFANLDLLLLNSRLVDPNDAGLESRRGDREGWNVEGRS